MAGGRMGRELDVLVFGLSDRVEALAEKLGRLALNCRLVRADSPPARRHHYWAVGVVLAECDRDVEDGMKAFQRFAPGERPLLVVGPDSYGPTDLVDAWIREPASAVQIAARIRALFRLHTMEIIARRRTEVSALYGQKPGLVERQDQPPCVLYVGDASPRFMALQHTLASVDAEVIAAFSSYSAFDYLHERAFDAVVLNAAGKRDIAFTISSAMRRNARLYHTPVLLLTDDVDPGAAEEAFARGVSDLLPPRTDDDELRERVLTLTAERRRRREAKAILESCRDTRSLDIETGLFHPAYLVSHIQDLLNETGRDQLHFSLIALQTLLPEGSERPDDVSAEKARRQFAAMLRHLLRTEDAAARFEDDVFLAVLPFTDPAGIDCVAARVAAIAECTAFESDDPLRPFRLSVRAAPVQTRPGETADALVERALASLVRPRPIIASA
ncbi:response regulator receiver modulated diguanylate cyclase [Maricaulis maris]|uniref:Response regulator receiver modulated diguanylate cyclase n=2 Tax=Maricaulaceae TaxID=2800061 RepID=A0A495DJP7_9PROT|nr:response regulator receiver modulated diguanylate cyclase [Maricaulis maris]